MSEHPFNLHNHLMKKSVGSPHEVEPNPTVVEVFQRPVFLGGGVITRFSDGGVEFKSQKFSEYFEPGTQADKVWQRRHSDIDSYYCQDCQQECSAEPHDFGIGPYEYWGARGTDRNVQVVSNCCEAGLEDFFGNSKEVDVRDLDTRDE